MFSLPVAVYTQNIKLSDAQKVGMSAKRLSIAHERDAAGSLVISKASKVDFGGNEFRV